MKYISPECTILELFNSDVLTESPAVVLSAKDEVYDGDNWNLSDLLFK